MRGTKRHMMKSTPSQNWKKIKHQFYIQLPPPPTPPRCGRTGYRLRRRGQWEYLNQQCFIWKFKLLNKGIIEMGRGCWVTPIDTFWSRRREMATQITLFINKRMMLKLTLGECWNQIRYINILHTPSENTFFPHCSPKYCPSTSEDSSQTPTPHPPAGQTACSCLSCENMRVGAQLCLQKCENVLFFFLLPHLLASLRDIPPFNVLFSLDSKILRIGFSHISSNENFHRLRFQVFQAPEGIQFPGRCLVYRGGGEKKGQH